MLTASVEDVRKLAISHQHLGAAARPPLLDLIRDLGCLQLDPISHVERSHWLVLWSRLGQFDRAVLEKMLYEDRTLYEYWAHCASIVLTEEYPVHQWRMRQREGDGRWGDALRAHYAKKPELQQLRGYILHQLTTRGALLSREIDQPIETDRIDHAWYSNRMVPHELHKLWEAGRVMVVGRVGKQRRWGLTAQFLPDWTPRTAWTDAHITRFAAVKAIHALGIATPQQIKKHYTRGRYPDLPVMLKQLEKEGVIAPVTVLKAGVRLPVKGKGTWWICTADLPRLQQIQAGEWHGRTTLLSPFDNLICDRDRTLLLWDFYFRIEIYVPKAKRQYGYYVLPILSGDRLVGRISPRMDRRTKTLYIEQTYWEEGVSAADYQAAVLQAIHSLAQFLAAENVVVEG